MHHHYQSRCHPRLLLLILQYTKKNKRHLQNTSVTGDTIPIVSSSSSVTINTSGKENNNEVVLEHQLTQSLVAGHDDHMNPVKITNVEEISNGTNDIVSYAYTG